MTTPTASVVTLSVVLLAATAWPVHASVATSTSENQGVIVHFLVRHPTPGVAALNIRHNAAARTVGLWRSPSAEELGRMYLKRRDYRQPAQAMPLLLIEW